MFERQFTASGTDVSTGGDELRGKRQTRYCTPSKTLQVNNKLTSKVKNLFKFSQFFSECSLPFSFSSFASKISSSRLLVVRCAPFHGELPERGSAGPSAESPSTPGAYSGERRACERWLMLKATCILSEKAPVSRLTVALFWSWFYLGEGAP